MGPDEEDRPTKKKKPPRRLSMAEMEEMTRKSLQAMATRPGDIADVVDPMPIDAPD